MFFRNAHIYRFEEPFTMTGQALNEALQGRKSRACGQMEHACEGWFKPLGIEGQMLVHEIDKRLMICLRREEKVLPASLVREQVEGKLFDLIRSTGRHISRKEKAEIRDSVTQELLPRALVKASHTFAYIDSKGGWLVVDAASAKRSFELITVLRKTLGTLNIVLPQTKLPPGHTMTQWLLNEDSIPNDFSVEDEVELRSSGQPASIIRCKHVDLGTKEVLAHISSGKRVYKIAMNWQEKISFILHDDLSIKRLRFNTELIEKTDVGNDVAAQFDNDFAIMSGELTEFIPALLSALNQGG